MKRTLLQEKSRPIHKLIPSRKTIVAHTWCGVDTYRKGVQTEGVNVGAAKATCKDCLRLEWEAEINAAEIKARKKGN